MDMDFEREKIDLCGAWFLRTKKTSFAAKCRRFGGKRVRRFGGVLSKARVMREGAPLHLCKILYTRSNNEKEGNADKLLVKELSLHAWGVETVTCDACLTGGCCGGGGGSEPQTLARLMRGRDGQGRADAGIYRKSRCTSMCRKTHMLY